MKNIILIPYGDRDIDMKYFLENSYPLLKKNIEVYYKKKINMIF